MSDYTRVQREQAADVLEKFQKGVYGHGGKVGVAIDTAIAALRNTESVDVIKDLLHQFAYGGTKQGRPILTTGGVDALERAFEFVGYDDPYFTREESI